MEPRMTEKPVESRGEAQTAPRRQPERKRRFQIVKLEERIAPRGSGQMSEKQNCNTWHTKCRI
jgi:hypothetical protein